MNEPMTVEREKRGGSSGAATCSANLPCPFCGSPCDDCRGGENDEDGWLGCDNQKCPASRLVMTAEQWNTRYSPNAEVSEPGGPKA